MTTEPGRVTDRAAQPDLRRRRPETAARKPPMPELPEVETVRRTLAPVVEGRTIAAVSFAWPRTCAGDPRATAARLAGQRIERLERYGKYLLFHLRKDGLRSHLVVHLRMTGNLLVNGAPDEVHAGQHVPGRRHGGGLPGCPQVRALGVVRAPAGAPGRAGSGAAGDRTCDEFTDRLRSRRARLKALLLDQEFLRGLGNIYADEALFGARLHPLRSADSVGPRKAHDLHGAIQAVLRDAIDAGGTSIRDYRDSRGVEGGFQRRIRIYGRDGQPCVHCGTRVRRVVVAQRSTHFCPRCQRR